MPDRNTPKNAPSLANMSGPAQRFKKESLKEQSRLIIAELIRAQEEAIATAADLNHAIKSLVLCRSVEASLDLDIIRLRANAIAVRLEYIEEFEAIMLGRA